MTSGDESSARRQTLLEAAEKLLKHYGFAKTTVADIAREAGVGVGTVYLEFASKEDIVAALSVQRHDRVLGAMQAVAAGEGGFGERLGQVLELRLAHFVRYVEEGQHGRDLVSCGCAAVGRVHAEFRAAEQALVGELIARGVAAGELAVEEPKTAARVLLSIYDGFLEDSACRQDEGERRRVLQCLRHVILEGLQVRPG